jgi:hypothetical protein
MRTLRLTLSALAALLAGAPLALAEDLLPPNKTIPEAVDHYIDARLKAEGVTPAPLVDDATFLRRVTLDLAGRIPTPDETRAYLASTDADKRVKLVDRLMASPALVRHQVNEFDTMLTSTEARRGGNMREYLTRALKENRPWDQMFREILLPDEKDPARKGAVVFLQQRVRDLDRLTTDVSVLFFGVNISCAQCHDHPLVPDWKQDHFYGLKSFLNRTYQAGPNIAERPFGIVQFKTTKGVAKQAKLMFLTGKIIEDPTAKDAPPPDLKGGKIPKIKFPRGKGPVTPPPAPKFSARAQLVEVALQPGQSDFFSRAIVNRLWHRLFGLGLVTPIDQMHSANAPSHPELLRWLARDLVEHKYDLRRLMRGLVLSKAYARSSRWDGPIHPNARLFAMARLRALTPMQLATSMRVATTAPDQLPGTLKAEDLDRRIESMENSARGFAALIEQPRDDFQIGVNEALLFSNSERINREFLADSKDRLVGHLKEIKDDDTLIDTAVRAAFSRPASADEKKLLGDYLRERKDRRAEACRQIVWALLASAEFRFNY